jgi:hypothetical protein
MGKIVHCQFQSQIFLLLKLALDDDHFPVSHVPDVFRRMLAENGFAFDVDKNVDYFVRHDRGFFADAILFLLKQLVQEINIQIVLDVLAHRGLKDKTL